MTSVAAVRRDLKRGWHIPGDQAPIRFGPHSIARFRERSRPGMPLEEVQRQLSRMLRPSTVSFEAPEWVPNPDPRTWGYLLVGDCVMPLRRERDELIAVTALARATTHPRSESA